LEQNVLEIVPSLLACQPDDGPGKPAYNERQAEHKKDATSGLSLVFAHLIKITGKNLFDG
jgi:hypothetical protein